MTRLNANFQVLGLALAVLLAQGCQQAEQPAAENQPASPADSAGTAASSQASSKPAAPAPSAAVKPAASAPAAAPARSATFPVGTAVKIRTTNTLSTKTLKTGDGFSAVLEEPLIVAGREVFPKGAMVMGKVIESDPGGRVKGVASLAIALNMLHTPDGQMLDITTNTVSIEADTSKAKDATKVAVGTAVGAAIGAIAGGKKGAGIGAATGAGAGTAVVLGTRGDAAEIASETPLEFSLTSPLTVSQ
ncbi:MAG: hypothetical protein HY316_09400 [Acidobacteria bacterium]|nr:hypothetical protein [Acidobacteriota bacterium]